MAIITRLVENNAWLISHEMFLQELYENHWIHGIFEINTPFMMDEQAKALVYNKETLKSRKRKKKTQLGSILPIEEKMQLILQKLMKYFQPMPTNEMILNNNRIVREKVKDLMNTSTSTFKNVKSIRGFNENEKSVKVNIEGRYYWIPTNCEYHLNDISNLKETFKNRKFKLIIMDPPWINKHVKRHKHKSDGYNMLDNDEIFNHIPINELLEINGFVVIWCTNSQKHLDAIEKWLKLWNLKLLSKWYWLKVTKSGEPITNFQHPHKKPYEILIIACSIENDITKLDTEQVIISVPSGIHSHKPPLLQIFCQTGMISDKDKCLEIFGRYLLPNCITFGNQCLLFQDADIYYSNS